MLRRLVFSLFLAVSCSVLLAAPATAKPPKALLSQVQRLGELLRDSYASLYPEATQVQMLKSREVGEMALVLFTVEGFGGGNSHTQYFAVFGLERDEQDKPYYTLIDVISIGGKGWRGIPKLNAQVSRPNKQEIRFDLEALEVAGEDAPNFPSRKTTINLLLKGGRLSEQK